MYTLTLSRGPAAPGWHISINVDNKAVEEWGHFIKSRVHPIVINHGNFMFAITVKSLYYSCTAIRSPCLDTIYRQFQVAWMFIVQWALWSLTSASSPGVLSKVVSMSPISRWWGRRMFWCGAQRARIRLHTSRRQRRECHPSSHWFWTSSVLLECQAHPASLLTCPPMLVSYFYLILWFRKVLWWGGWWWKPNIRPIPTHLLDEFNWLVVDIELGAELELDNNASSSPWSIGC